MTNDFLAAALGYTQQDGYRHPLKIFPLNAGQKIPLIGKKNGGHGWKDATLSDSQIKKWWELCNNANIGIPTGSINGILVIDVDIKPAENNKPAKRGDESLHELESRFGPLPSSWLALTPSGGEHRFFRYPSNYNIKDSASVIGKDIDIRAEGGYIVGVGSKLSNGKTYQWKSGCSPSDLPLADLPIAWIEYIDSCAKGNKSIAIDAPLKNSARFQLPDIIPNGQRNSILCSYAGSLRAQGVKPMTILASLQKANIEACKPSLLEEEIIEIYNSIMRYAEGKSSASKSDTQELVDSLLKKNKNDVNENTAENYLTIFRNDEEFSNVKYNLLKEYPERVIDGKRYQWTDTDDSRARTYIESIYHLSNVQKYSDAFAVFQHEREYNPVIELINSFTWDGIPRVEEFLIKWLNVEDTPYSREASRLIFAGGINRACKAGCKFDSVIVLIGKQGGGKSTICQWLALEEDFYSSTKTIATSNNKGYEAIQGVWICEIEELLAVLANDRAGSKIEESAKAFLSTQSDHYRLPYAKRPTDNPRHNIFIGTTNRAEFLTDKTGNRRWYPIRCNPDANKLYKQKDEVKEYIRQCWAEMLDAFKRGDALAQPNEKRELLKDIKAEQEDAEIDDYRIGLIERYVEGKDKVCCYDIAKNVFNYGYSPSSMPNNFSRDIGDILVNKLHWIRGSTTSFKDYGKQKAFINPARGADSASHIDDNPFIEIE